MINLHGSKYKNTIQNRINSIIANISKDFNIASISKSPSRFSKKKLDWFNQQYIANLPLKEYVTRASLLKLKKEGGLVNLTLDEDNSLTADNLTPVKITIKDEQGTKNLLISEDLNTESLNLIQTHTYFNYWILVDFLHQHNNPLKIKLGKNVLTEFLSYKLDQNRSVTLADFQTESKCITSYQKPLAEEVKWKKNTIEESLESLKKMVSEICLNLEFWKISLKQALSKLEGYSSISSFEIEELILKLANISHVDKLDTYYFNLLEFLYFRDGNTPDTAIKELDVIEHFYKVLTEAMELSGKEFLTANNLDFGLYLWPIRVAIAGKVRSPSLFEMMPILGVKEIRQRVSCFI